MPERYMKFMRYFILIAILFSLENCSQKSSNKEYKLTDDYSSVITRMKEVNLSDQALSQRQFATFSLLNNFMKTYPLSQTTLELLASAKNLSAPQYDSLYNNLNPTLRDNPYWASVDVTKSQIHIAETGKLFPEISISDKSKASISTGKFKGKILFLDLWSSWCGSCRKQFPDLKQIYAKYNPKGLEIIGVSMDEKKDAWNRALNQDNLPWPQYCELVSFLKNSLAKRFHIMSIPTNFLIDRNGLLIGQNLSPQELETIISKL